MPPSFDDLIKQVEAYESQGCSTYEAVQRLCEQYPKVANLADQLIKEKQRKQKDQRFGKQ